MVPAARYPRDRCTENSGAGWDAQIQSATGRTAVVRYLRARTAAGNYYEDTREPLDALVPLE